MPRFDPDLIAALAEGRLPADEAEELEARVAEDPAAAAELAAQRRALAFIAAAPPAELSEGERADLRNSVAEALGITPLSEVVERPQRQIPWTSLGIAAAALAGLIAVVPIVGLLSTGGDSDTGFELAAEAPTTTDLAEQRVAAADEAEADDAPTALLDMAPPEGAVTLAEAAGGELPSPASDASAASSSTSATEEAAAAEPAAPVDGASVEHIGRISDEIGVLREDPESLDEMSRAAAPEEVCWFEDTELRADPPPDRFVFEYEDGELTVIVYFEVADGHPGAFRVWGLPDCAELIVINGEE